MTLATGTKLGPYQIESAIGQGGMGEVYRATDTRLGRTVAIKLLKDPHAHRFEREAKAIAALNHPHICTLYDAAYDADPAYLVMEYIEGTPLGGPLVPDEARRLALQIAGALEAAHARGVVHRDLKPANILVNAAGVKLLDFGLARMDSGAFDRSLDATAETMPGMVMGTAAYMSPEQARGQRADERSDIFAFGIVLYEMLSGRQPFNGDNMVATLAAVLHQEPPPLDAPAALRAIVSRCLQKRPDDRFQTVADVRLALEHLDTQPIQTHTRESSSIAVLPFANMSADKDNEYFSDGLAEEILNALTRIPDLKVSARTSSFAFRGKEQDIRTIGERLDVRTILEGSVRRSGNRIRVTAQLINASDGYHLWSERYERELRDIFEVQDEIATAIATALRLTLAHAASAGPRYLPTLPAYEAYLQARHHFFQQTSESVPRAIEGFQRAAALDPQYPAPHIELGACYLILWYFGLRSGKEMTPLIAREARLAQELGHFTPRGNGLLGVIAAAYNYDREEAARLFDASLKENVGSDAEARWSYATFYLAPAGRFDEALRLLELVIDADPLNTTWRGATAQYLNMAGRHELALQRTAEIMALDSKYWVAYLYAAEAYAALGRWPEARAAAETAFGVGSVEPAREWHARGGPHAHRRSPACRAVDGGHGQESAAALGTAGPGPLQPASRRYRRRGPLVRAVHRTTRRVGDDPGERLADPRAAREHTLAPTRQADESERRLGLATRTDDSTDDSD